MAVGASRGSLSFAFAAILAACPLLQLALALSTGDVLFVNDAAYDSADVLRAPTLTVRLCAITAPPVHTAQQLEQCNLRSCSNVSGVDSPTTLDMADGGYLLT